MSRGPRPVCSVPDCGRPHRSHGYCNLHQYRWRMYGDPLVTRRRWSQAPAIERFYDRVHKDDASGCWLWTGGKDRHGYGGFTAATKPVPAHRWAYEHFVGPIPDGLVIDHLCRNPPCVNPAHLEPVTQRENLLRGVGISALNARKTHCKHGHEFTPENTYVYWKGRKCRACMKALKRRRAAA